MASDISPHSAEEYSVSIGVNTGYFSWSRNDVHQLLSWVSEFMPDSFRHLNKANVKAITEGSFPNHPRIKYSNVKNKLSNLKRRYQILKSKLENYGTHPMELEKVRKAIARDLPYYEIIDSLMSRPNDLTNSNNSPSPLNNHPDINLDNNMGFKNNFMNSDREITHSSIDIGNQVSIASMPSSPQAITSNSQLKQQLNKHRNSVHTTNSNHLAIHNPKSISESLPSNSKTLLRSYSHSGGSGSRTSMSSVGNMQFSVLSASTTPSSYDYMPDHSNSPKNIETTLEKNLPYQFQKAQSLSQDEINQTFFPPSHSSSTRTSQSFNYLQNTSSYAGEQANSEIIPMQKHQATQQSYSGSRIPEYSSIPQQKHSNNIKIQDDKKIDLEFYRLQQELDIKKKESNERIMMEKSLNNMRSQILAVQLETAKVELEKIKIESNLASVELTTKKMQLENFFPDKNMESTN